MELKEPTATSRYALWLTWTVRAGLVLLVLAFVADLAGFARRIPLERMPEIWSAPVSAHAERVSSVVLVAIAWLASCSVACLAPLLPLVRKQREDALAATCVVQILVVAFAALAGTLLR